jgi:hypothetical protein
MATKQPRMQYAHPDNVREPADTKPYHRRKMKGAWVFVNSWPLPRSRYMPHQGDQEKARRAKKMMELHGRNPVVRFYGSLSGGEVV